MALYRRGIKALKKIKTIGRLEKAVEALEVLAKIKTTKKGDIRITSKAYKSNKKNSKAKRAMKLHHKEGISLKAAWRRV